MRGLALLEESKEQLNPSTPTTPSSSATPSTSTPAPTDQPVPPPSAAGNMSVGLNIMSLVVHIFENSALSASKRMMMKTRFLARYDTQTFPDPTANEQRFAA